ncbi:MAG: large-conductance mechanosensitive channel protein MscL [Firmicutes bacterium]|nr:large-conductance mechanosensitive channel protein MscL [Clostridiales bacterium]MBQ9931513.1 large-conductance mechanosensitive channel protein MscL [Bacillota bacterium]
MLKEFKAFITRGNVVDMAVGVIVGGAFGKIVTSLVNDLIMPAISFLTAGVDVKDLKFVLSPAQLDATGAVVKAESAIMYGNFIQTAIDFIIIAFAIFMMIKAINTMHKKLEKPAEPAPEEPAAPPAPTEAELLTEIRDLLKNK